jgi:branched-chain amino acid transport system substrate-binding protein
MSVFASPPEFGPAGIGPLAFSGGIMTPDEAAVAAEFAYGKKRWRTAYELEDASIDYTRSFHQYFRQTWKRLGGTFVGRDTFQNADPSIATQITRIRSLAKQPDFILMTSYNPGGASAVRQIRAAGIDTPILSGQPMDGTYWVNAVPNLRNFYVSTYASFMGDDANPFVNTLRERFRKKTGRYPTLGYFVTGYNVVDLLAKAIEKAGTTDGKALARTLETFKDVQTRPLGKTCFSKRWHVSLCRPFAVVEFRDGKPRFLGRFIPRYVPQPRLSGK